MDHSSPPRRHTALLHDWDIQVVHDDDYYGLQGEFTDKSFNVVSVNSDDTSYDEEESDASSSLGTTFDNDSMSSDDYSDDEDASCSSSSDDEEDGQDILNQLHQNNPSLTSICLHPQSTYFPSTTTQWTTMGHMLQYNTHITDLSILNNIHGEAISMEDERALYCGLQYNRSIRTLHLTGPFVGLFPLFLHPCNPFWTGGTNNAVNHDNNNNNHHLVELSLNGLELNQSDMEQLCEVVTTSTQTRNLEAIGITHCWSREDGGHHCLFGGEDGEELFSILLRLLRNFGRRGMMDGQQKQKQQSLKRLELQGNEIGLQNMTKLVRTIRQWCPDLEELNLQDTTIGYTSCKALASLLRDPTLHLSSLDLWRCSMDDDCAALLADALRDNTTLQFLNLGGNHITRWKNVFSTLLCNKSSIVETFACNHTLEDLGLGVGGGGSNDELVLVDDLLGMNLSDDKRAVAMNKVIKFHLGEVVEIVDLKLLPNIMTCIGAEQNDSCHERCRCDLLSAMFSIVRSTPALFQYSRRSIIEGDGDYLLDVANGLEKMRLSAPVCCY
eukprot:CAMPEP_0201714664 /NCGR_PEP_ID=MMETSP0593-20130828/1043_1 /ASSEMBLY_ACC=CAM_ASM_000672 /TAXON_ID=267983 /ORGANISM="Skeletonema japonicum, Strain CCMP2506" /LENGTH=553 /DNA_ID=CAMNT_0048203959 /DNA_START=187 /DNA_END=1848 /DNA_ORIENTATION=-